MAGFTGENEEERRKREEEERRAQVERAAMLAGLPAAAAPAAAAIPAAAYDAMAGLTAGAPAAPQGANWGDIPGALYDKKMGEVNQRLAGVQQMAEDPQEALRKRLLGPSPEEAADTVVKTQQVKTYGDGSQEQTVKTQIPAPAMAPVPQAQAMPAAMPAAMPQARPPVQQPPVPTTGAVSPAQMAGQPTMAAPAAQMPPPAAMPQAPAPQMAPAAGAVSPAQMAGQPPAAVTPPAAVPGQLPAAGPINPAEPPPQIGQIPRFGPGVQVAGAPGAPAPQLAGAPAVTPTVEPLTLQQQQQQSVIDARNEQNPDRRRQMFAKLLSDETVDAGTKALANRFIAEDYIKEQKINEANKKIEEATPTELARYMKERNKEGSYVKAILFARLGLNDLAKREQDLLNPDLKMETATVGSDRYTVARDPLGAVIKAFDVEGREVGQRDLAKISAAAMPTKSFLLPQSAGGLMQKTIVGPDGKEQVITGQVFTDPQTNTTYFQAGNKRYDTTGLSTPAQNVENIYGAAGAKQQATQAAQTGKPQGTLPARDGGGAGGENAANVPAADPAAARRAQADIDGLQREIAKAQKGTGVSSTAKAEQLQILNAELKKAQQQLATASGTGGVPQPSGAGGQRPDENFLQYQDRIKRESAAATAATTANIDLSKEERSNFLTYEEKDIVPKADAGGSISGIRKQQLKGPDGILNNPEIVGMLSGQGGTVAEVGNIIRDLVTGARTDEELSTRVASLGLSQRQKDVLMNQIALNRQVAPFTLKQNAGPGSVSDAEQKANREAAVNIARVPLYTAVTMLSKDQFDKDLQVSRQIFRQNNPELSTVRSFNGAWGKEKARLEQEYNQIYAERAKYIGKYYQDGANPKAITEAYKHYPVPEYNRQTGSWDYGTDFARKAARPRLDSFNR